MVRKGESHRNGEEKLPKEIVEQIFAMIPYPSIFKCRCLSKSWFASLGSVSSEASKAKKSIAISFQKQVGEWSNSWKTLCPVFAKNNQDFIAYDRISQQWQRLPSLPVIPAADLLSEELEIQTEGALLYAFCLTTIRSKKYVANILTGAWKQLPACPLPDIVAREKVTMTTEVLREKLVRCESSETYKVIMLCTLRRVGFQDDIDLHELFTQIYDSKLDAWSIKEVVFPCELKSYYFAYYLHDNCALYLNGVLYFFAMRPGQLGLLAFNVEEGTLEELNVQSDKLYCRSVPDMMVSWNDNLLIVLGQYTETMCNRVALKVLKFDFQSEQLSELAECSFPALEINRLAQPLKPVFDGHCIFFGVEQGSTRMLTYNVDKNEWNRFPIASLQFQYDWEYKWVGCVFQPGLSPFAEV